ncbi:MAG: proline dehydrogenase family protein, partial [Gemmatimonadales bacterium]
MADPATYIVQGLRSPFSRIDRELEAFDALQLSVPVAQQTVVGEIGLGIGGDRQVDLVVWGSVIPSLAVANWGREVWLDAALDQSVPALTIVQQCATSLAAATHAAAQARAGKIDLALCYDNLLRLLSVATEKNIFVRLDMEGSDLTESTISIFESAYPDHPDHVGIVLQAYLHRTAEDVARMCDLNARVRICKGAYGEPAEIAYQDMPTIRERYVDYMKKLIVDGRYPGIATHDDILIEATKTFVR